MVELILYFFENDLTTVNSGLEAATFFSHFQPCGLYSDMIYVVILHFFHEIPWKSTGCGL